MFAHIFVQQVSAQVLWKGSVPGLYPCEFFTATGWITGGFRDRGYRSQFPLINTNRPIIDHPVTEVYSLLKRCKLIFSNISQVSENTKPFLNISAKHSFRKLTLKYTWHSSQGCCWWRKRSLQGKPVGFTYLELFFLETMQIMSLLSYTQNHKE